MFALVVLWLFTTPSFYQGAVLLKGRAALILSKLENKNKPAKTGLFLLEIQTGQFRYKKIVSWHGLDSTARKNPSNDDYHTP